MYSGLLLHLCHHTEVYFLDGKSAELCVEQHVELKERFVIYLFVHIYDPVSYYIAFDNNDCKKVFRIHSRELHKLKLVKVCGGSGDHCGVLGISGKHFDDRLEHVLKLILPFKEHILDLGHFPFLRFHKCINIEAVSFIGRNSSRRSVGLNDVPHLLEVGHLVSDGGGA